MQDWSDVRRLPELETGILDGSATVAGNKPVVLPVHARTLPPEKDGILVDDTILVIEAIQFLDIIALELASPPVVVSSGSVQKEAHVQPVPHATPREKTEWNELVDAGWNCPDPPHQTLGPCTPFTGPWGQLAKTFRSTVQEVLRKLFSINLSRFLAPNRRRAS